MRACVWLAEWIELSVAAAAAFVAHANNESLPASTILRTVLFLHSHSVPPGAILLALVSKSCN